MITIEKIMRPLFFRAKITRGHGKLPFGWFDARPNASALDAPPLTQAAHLRRLGRPDSEDNRFLGSIAGQAGFQMSDGNAGRPEKSRRVAPIDLDPSADEIGPESEDAEEETQTFIESRYLSDMEAYRETGCQASIAAFL